MLENYKEVVEALEDTNESVITHRLNDVLRLLTAFSVILLPLTLIALDLGHERGRARRGVNPRVLDHRRGDGGHLRQLDRVLPPPRLALARTSQRGDRGPPRRDVVVYGASVLTP